jgi:hypothetical protein
VENNEIAEAAVVPPLTAPARLASIPGQLISSTRGRGGRRRLYYTPTPTPSPTPSPSPSLDSDNPYKVGTTAPRRSARFIAALEDNEDSDLTSSKADGSKAGDSLISARYEGLIDIQIRQDKEDELTTVDDS